jgi:hypothetical protein
MLEIKESDWKVLRRVYPLAHGRFCEQVLAEVESLLHDRERSSRERYLDLRDLIECRDRQMARLFDSPRRSTALPLLARLREEGLLTDEDFSCLSTDTRCIIGLLINPGPR